VPGAGEQDLQVGAADPPGGERVPPAGQSL